MIVQELIDALQQLPESSRNKRVSIFLKGDLAKVTYCLNNTSIAKLDDVCSLDLYDSCIYIDVEL